VNKTSHKFMLGLFFALSILSFSGLLGCASQNSKPMPPVEVSKTGLQKIVNHTLDSVVIENVMHWQQVSKGFMQASHSYCQALPNGEGLKNMQNQYRKLVIAWNQTMPFDFGPLRDNLFFPKVHFVDSMRQRGKDYTATINTHFVKRLNDAKPLDQKYFEKLKFTLVGMPAIEILLFPEEKQTNQSLINAYQNPRHCELLMGLAKLNSDIAQTVLDGWTQSEGGNLSYSQMFKTDQLPDGEKSLTKLIFAMQDYLRYVLQRQLNGRLDYKRSHLEFESLLAGLTSVQKTFNANQSGYGILDYLNKSGKEIVAQNFTKELEMTKQALNNKEFDDLKKHYARLIKVLEKDIPQALGLNLGINFVDGD